MTSTATTRNRLEKQGTGDNSNTWGTYLNGSIDLIDAALDGRTAFALSGSKTLTSANYSADESRERFLDITGGTGGTVTIPAVEKWYIVRNNASGNVVFTTGSGTTQTVAPGSLTLLVSDGTNIRKGVDQDYVATAIAAAQFATALPSQTGNAGKYATTDGTTASWSDPFASPTLTGTPVAPTAAAGTNTTQLATTAFVKTATKMELISTTNASGATTVDFTGLSNAYAYYVVVGANISTAAASVNLLARTSTNNGSSYDSGASDYAYTQSILVGSSVTGSSSSANAAIIVGGFLTAGGFSFLMNVLNAGNAARCVIQARLSDGQSEYILSGRREAATAVNALRIYSNSSAFSGTFYLYGVKA